jgi:hypothetical protein
LVVDVAYQHQLIIDLCLARSLPMDLKKSSSIFNYFLLFIGGWYQWILWYFAVEKIGFTSCYLPLHIMVFGGKE